MHQLLFQCATPSYLHVILNTIRIQKVTYGKQGIYFAWPYRITQLVIFNVYMILYLQLDKASF